MAIIIGVFVGVLLWHFIGIVAITAIDDDNQSIYKWAMSAPNGFYSGMVLTLWPLIVAYNYYLKHKKDPLN